jgi:4'-phosphopantetheinyl transferase
MVQSEEAWPLPPPTVRLTGGEIHVWRAWLEEPARGGYDLARILSPEERQRAKRVRFERDRLRFVAARAALRIILGRYLAVQPQDVCFAYGQHGRPYLASEIGNPRLDFNAAHSGPLAVFAVASDMPIGVDVEQVREMPDADDVAARFFSAREYADYAALPADAKQLGFYMCWTRKEAFIKALGEGLAHPLDQFDVSLAPGEPARLLRVALDPDEAKHWSLISLTPAPGFVAALAVRERAPRVTCWDYQEFC